MADSEFQEGNYDDERKMKEKFKKDIEELVEHVEKLTVRIAWVVYDSIALRTNPDLSNAMGHLEGVFLRCKEEMKKKCQEKLMESGGEEKKE